VFLFSPIRATRPAHLILFDSIILTSILVSVVHVAIRS
jgi:hypothetical protein